MVLQADVIKEMNRYFAQRMKLYAFSAPSHFDRNIVWDPGTGPYLVGNQQPARRLLRVFELPAPGNEVSGRSLDLRCDKRLGVVNEAADVPPFGVAC
jgi:hypothetical protein